MERELWPRLYKLVKEAGKAIREPGVTYPASTILLVFLWAALHDRPVSWACEMRNWSTTRLRPWQLPANSTLSVRLRTLAVKQLFETVSQRLREIPEPGLIKRIDGKPLPVGGCSKDPDARAGRAAGGKAVGYKLHAIWSGAAFPAAWDVRPMNVNEMKVAYDLVPQLWGEGYLLADTQFDGSRLHDLARRHGHQLVAPRRKGPKALGHTYQSPYRLHCLAMLTRDFGRKLLTARRQVERTYGNLTSFSCGLGPLPAWVRRHHRVHRWVWAKLIINAVRILQKQRLAA